MHMNVDLTGFRRSLRSFETKQVPFASALALNDTADDVGEAFERETDRKLDRPTPFTRRGVYKVRANKRRLVAEIGYKTIQARYLGLQITGGTRRPSGAALIVPAGARLNKYGNLPKGSVRRSIQGGKHFVASKRSGRSKHLPPGVYKRTKTGVQMMVAFENVATYQKRLHFGAAAETAVRMNFARHFARRFEQAMLTAR